MHQRQSSCRGVSSDTFPPAGRDYSRKGAHQLPSFKFQKYATSNQMAPKRHQLLRDGPPKAEWRHQGSTTCWHYYLTEKNVMECLLYLCRLDAWFSHTRPLMASSAPGK